MSKLVQSKNLSKFKNITLSEIKSMIETFTIKEEKFINQTYNLNLGVSFNKKKVFNYLNVKKIFPSQIIEENFISVKMSNTFNASIGDVVSISILSSKCQIFDDKTGFNLS